MRAVAKRKIPPPISDDDIERFVRELREDPNFTKCFAAFRRAQEGSETFQRYRRGESFTPARVRLHEKIVSKLLNAKAASPEGTTPVGAFFLGLPGAGKSSRLKDLLESHVGQREWTIVDPDLIKREFPEYRGYNAALFHEESSYVSREFLFPAALGARHNIIVDQVGRDATRLIQRVDALASAEYEIYALLGRVPKHLSQANVVERFLKAGKDGRWVPPEVISVAAEAIPTNWARLRAQRSIKGYWAYDMTTNPPTLFEKGPA